MLSTKCMVWTSFLILALGIYLQQRHHAYVSSYLSMIPFGRKVLHAFDALFVKLIPLHSSELQCSEDLGEILMDSHDLEAFDGKKGSEKLYLSILGQIFDVSKGKKFYGPGSHYHFFTGRDASRAFVSGDFSDSGLTDDVSDLDREQLRSLKKWTEFYHKEYKYIGKLVGRYYDSQGYETPYLLKMRELLRRAVIEEDEGQKEKFRFPSCNSEWQINKGSRVWCSKRSGGIERSWVGVPRKLFIAGSSSTRCVCVRHPKEESLATSYEPKLEDPQLEEYPGCPKDSHSCLIEA